MAVPRWRVETWKGGTIASSRGCKQGILFSTFFKCMYIISQNTRKHSESAMTKRNDYFPSTVKVLASTSSWNESSNCIRTLLRPRPPPSTFVSGFWMAGYVAIYLIRDTIEKLLNKSSFASCSFLLWALLPRSSRGWEIVFTIPKTHEREETFIIFDARLRWYIYYDQLGKKWHNVVLNSWNMTMGTRIVCCQ